MIRRSLHAPNRFVPLRGFTLIEVLVVIAIVGVLLAISLPAVQWAREASRQVECKNNLKQIGLAAALHEQSYRRYPTGGWGYRWVGDPARGFDKRQPGGWIFCILPQLEQQNVFDLGYAQDEPERRSRLATMIQTPLATFHCPSRRFAEMYPNRWQPFNALPIPSVAKCDYAANAGDVFFDVGSGPVTLAQGDHAGYVWPAYPATGVVFLRSGVRVSQVTDGTTNTYLIGEKNLPSSSYENGNDRGDDQSMYSGDDFDTVRWTTNGWTPLNDEPGESAEARFGSAHSSGCNFTFCDGSVRAISYSIDAQTHQRLGSRSDGNVVSLPSN